MRGVLLAWLAVLSTASAPAPAALVTSDTADYCLALASRMDAHPDMQPDARELLASGRALCQHGQIQPGLLRLRRAMALQRASRPP